MTILVTGDQSLSKQVLLGRLIGANMNTTADQSIRMASSRYILRRISVVNVSTSLSLAAGGIYTGAGKTGTTIVAAAQVYSALTGSTKYLDLTIALTTDILTANLIYLSLTMAQGGAATADLYFWGDDLT